MGRSLRLTGVGFVFCNREAYTTVRGFPKRIYTGEDRAFVQDLKEVEPCVGAQTDGRLGVRLREPFKVAYMFMICPSTLPIHHA